MHFLKCLLVFVFWLRKFIFEVLGLQFLFWALKTYFVFSTLYSKFFLTPCKIPVRWIYCYYYYYYLLYLANFRPQIPFLGSRGLFLPVWPPKVYFFMFHVKFPIDGYITRPYWFWAPNSVFGLWGTIFAFLTSKSIYFLHLGKTGWRWPIGGRWSSRKLDELIIILVFF
jgi:hypothetical protein